MIEDSFNNNGRENTPGTPDQKRGKLSYKVVEDDFSPRTLRLAIKGKTFLRKSIAVANPFPKTVPIDVKDRFVWSLLQEAAEDNETLQLALKEADRYTRLSLTTFVRISLLYQYLF